MPFYCGKRSAGICVVLGAREAYLVLGQTHRRDERRDTSDELRTLATEDDSGGLLVSVFGNRYLLGRGRLRSERVLREFS